MASVATIVEDVSACEPDRRLDTAPRLQGKVGRSLSLERDFTGAMPSQSVPMGSACASWISSFAEVPIPGWFFGTEANLYKLLVSPAERASYGAIPVNVDLAVTSVAMLTEFMHPYSPVPVVECTGGRRIRFAWSSGEVSLYIEPLSQSVFHVTRESSGEIEEWKHDVRSDDPGRLASYIAQFSRPFSASHDASLSQFRALADEWERDTCFLSSTTKMVMHPAYQRIIGMGPAAIPLILRKLKRGSKSHVSRIYDQEWSCTTLRQVREGIVIKDVLVIVFSCQVNPAEGWRDQP